MHLYMSWTSDKQAKARSSEKWLRRYTSQLHVRRSLDSYHYHTLSDLRRRDDDRLVSRLFTRAQPPHSDEVMIVVD